MPYRPKQSRKQIQKEAEQQLSREIAAMIQSRTGKLSHLLIAAIFKYAPDGLNMELDEQSLQDSAGWWFEIKRNVDTKTITLATHPPDAAQPTIHTDSSNQPNQGAGLHDSTASLYQTGAAGGS